MRNKLAIVTDYVLRALFGAVFIFSGFVKAVDPMGTAYKIEEYLNAFGLDFLLNPTLTLPVILSVGLCVVEFCIGAMILLHIYNKPVRWTAAFFMLFFTITTFVDALTNNVSDCGCFGDAVKLTNWQTFWKNIVLDVVLVGIFFFDKKGKENYRRVLPFVVTLLFVLFALAFSIRNIIYEPVIDFRPWKIGNKMAPTIEEQKPPVAFATYRNNADGKEREFSMNGEGEGSLMEAYEKDPEFEQNWTYVEGKERVINTNVVAADGFSLVSIGGDKDESLDILGESTKDLYIVAVWNLATTSSKGMEKIVKYVNKLDLEKNNIIVVTSSNTSKWYDFSSKYKLQNFVFYSCDDKAIKAMIRSNPGLVHLKKGVVKDKWSWRELSK